MLSCFVTDDELDPSDGGPLDECGNTTRPYPLIPQVMNGTGALRQFVPRSLGIDPGRPWRDPGERAPTRRLKLRAIPIASSSKRRSAFNPASRPEGFRQYAEEAVRWARKSKTEQEKQALMDLACTWTQAAVQSEYIFGRQRQSARAQSSVRGASVVGLVRREHGYHDTCDHHHRPADSFRRRLVRPGTLVLGRSKSVKELPR
jgi:hypothetical protein